MHIIKNASTLHARETISFLTVCMCVCVCADMNEGAPGDQRLSLCPITLGLQLAQTSLQGSSSRTMWFLTAESSSSPMAMT